MKILHVSDFHGFYPWFEWLAEESLRYDMVLFAGDFVEMMAARQRAPLDEQWAEIGVLLRLLLDRPGAMVLCNGNHDGREELVNLAGGGNSLLPMSWTIADGAVVANVPYGFPFDVPGRDPAIRRVLTAASERAEELDLPLVVATHAPPSTPEMVRRTRIGQVFDPVLERIIRDVQPAYVASGHSHIGFERLPFTRLGRSLCGVPMRAAEMVGSPPNRIAIDTHSREVTWMGSDGSTIREALP